MPSPSPTQHPQPPPPYDEMEIQQNAGKVLVMGNLYEGVRPEELSENRCLGQGSFGYVYQSDFHGCILAVKKILRTERPSERKQMFTDLEVVRRCSDSDFIVKCRGYVLDSDFLYICMEMMATSLDRLLRARRKGLPDIVLGRVAYSVTHGLAYLKSRNIIHRDVKPSNILMGEQGNFKLCDFGMAGTLINSNAITHTQGTKLYLAPERILAMEQNNYDTRADVWSFGVSMVELATGRHPFHGVAEMALPHRVRQEEPPRLALGQITGTADFRDELCDFVNSCLQRDPAERPRLPVLVESPLLQKVGEADMNLSQWALIELDRIEAASN